MTYELKQLLEDKDLRRQIVKNPFIFVDHNGVFDLDFQEQSLRVNHRATFDRLCELGGEELLSKLLAEGNTCLTDDVNAANQGVRRIKGTDRFFLKTAAGDPTTLTSILFGIAGWAEMSSNFDLGCVFLQTCSDNDEEDEDRGQTFPFPDLEDMPLWVDEDAIPTPANVSLVQKGGKYAFYDEDEQTFVVLKDADGQDVSMAVCQPLKIPEMQENQVDAGPIEHMGWIYKAEDTAGAPWGWISADCKHVSAPVYDWVTAYCTGSHYGPNSAYILAYIEEESQLYHTRGNKPFELALFPVTINSDEIATLCFVQDPKRDWALLLKGNRGTLSYRNRFQYHYHVELENNILSFSALGHAESHKYICNNLTLECCLEHIEFVENDSEWASLSGNTTLVPQPKPSEYTDIRFLYSVEKDSSSFTCYAVRRPDCYWAVVRVVWDSVFTGKIRQFTPITPFAFTNIRLLYQGSNMVLLDQFGKKGAFDCDLEFYPIPCEYEEIIPFGANYTVKKAGFSGVVSHSGKWVEHLHR